MATQNETEVTILCKIGNFDGLEQAFDKEHHLQAQICKNDKGMVRIRKTDFISKRTNSATLELTTKTQISDSGVRSVKENTETINEQIFAQLLEVADKYMDKIRYAFKMEKLEVSYEGKVHNLSDLDLVYEVDVFKKKDGSISQWCKIDVEIQGINQKLEELGVPIDAINLNIRISHLPFNPTDFILVDEEENEDKQALIKALFDNEFLIVND